jgi:glyoxylase-like metal-dependent hydrolase (beta-lactamase superfamily II)/rhodanese-related sulfurtransferase
MKIEQIYTGCLAHGAYYIESNGEAAIIDPLREPEPYIRKATQNNATIKYIFETHFHADFVSGHLDLAQKTGAEIIFGPGAQPAFKATIAEDGQLFPLGSIFLKLLHTPGHTMESYCLLLIDETGKETALFSGDTLFIGDVGRPDLAQKAAGMTTEQLAGVLFDSLRRKIMPLPDNIVVYPGHGAGSACGKNMSRETTDTLGHQKKLNYALRSDMSREAFIKEVTAGLTPPPAYFPYNVAMNKQGYESLDTVRQRAAHALSPEAFEAAANETGALVLDTRSPDVFVNGFIPGAVNIGLDGSFAPWAGALITDITQPILIVADDNRHDEAVVRLARVGYDHCIGYLEGGFARWQSAGKSVDHIPYVSAEELTTMIQQEDTVLLDVRRNGEYQGGHVTGAINIPLDYINEGTPGISKLKTYYVHCASGYRSVIFISILRARGYDNLVQVAGGYKAIKETGWFPLSGYAYPATQL